MKLIEKIKKFNIKKKKTRFILSFIGSVIYGLGGVTSIALSHYSVYITSYFHYNKVNIDMHYGNLILPILNFSNSIFSPLAGYIERKLGLYLALSLSFILLELDIILFINQMNIWFTFVLIIFLGCSNGIGMAIPGKNLYQYYPEKSGIINTSLISCYIIIGTTLGVIGEKIINPEQYTLGEGEQFYPLEISKNYKKYYKFVLCMNPFALIISLLLIKKYNPEYEKELTEENNNTEENNKNNTIRKDNNYSKNIKSAIINKRIWCLIGIANLTPFVIIFSKNTFRVYGALVNVSGSVLQYSILFTSFSSIIVGPIWGYLNDKYRYEIIIKILSICCIIQALFLSIFIKSNTIYIIFILFGSVIITGFTSASHLHILRVYGIKYSLEIGGVIGIFGGIINILNTSLSLIVSKYFQNGDELRFAYRLIYIAGILISGLGGFLAFYEKDDKYLYPFSQNENDYLTMINSDSKDNEKEKGEDNVNLSKEIELEVQNNSSDVTVDSA
jgi:MFS family permease